MTAAVRRVLIDCDGAAAQTVLDARDWEDRRQIRSAGPDADLSLNMTALGGAILKTLSKRSTDLIRLAAYVYRADQIISRGGGRDAHAAHWRRHLTLCMPVSEPDLWATPAIVERLTAALRFLTDDVWEFVFSAAPPELQQLPLDVPTEEVIGQPNSVVLLSGGLDSLCVLLETAANGGRPIAVSHWSTETHRAWQQALLTQVRQRFPGWAFPFLGLPLHGVSGDPPDSSQRSRGFLYAALATAIASELRLERVLFGDNGPISVNLPINDQLVGALASRATHPQFLYRFNQLTRKVYSSPITVMNPLQERTRAEALDVLKRTQCADLLPLTHSCAKWRGLPAATPHCGECSQCVDRRFATIAAELEHYDAAARYRRDVFLSEPSGWEAEETAQSYVRFAQRVFPLGDAELVGVFPQVFNVPTPDDPNPETAIRKTVELAKRHATVTLDVVKTMVDRHRDELVEGSLPPGCLLRKVLGGTDPLATAEAEARSTTDPSQLATPPPSGDAVVVPAENVFAREGRLWTLSYGGMTAHMPDSVGMARLAVLLREPKREFHPEEILLAAGGFVGGTMAATEAETLGLWPEGYAGGGTKLDKPARDTLGEEITRLLREMDVARDNDDSDEVEALDAQIRRIGQEVKAGVGFGGKLKPFVETRSRRRDTVYRSLYRTLSDIRESHPVLGDHLMRSVHRKAPYSYAPDSRISWRVVLPKKQA